MSEQHIAHLQDLSKFFDELCQKRHEMGEKEYGSFTFMGNDVVRMMIEELADTANYCRYQAVKLLLLQEWLEEELEGKSDADGNISVGVQSFKGVGEFWNSH